MLSSMLFLLAYLLVLAGSIAAVVYYAVKRKYIPAIICAMIVIVAWQVSPESYFDPYPFIDTVRTKEFSVEKFETVYVGMNRADVDLLIGLPQNDHKYARANGIECQSYTNDGHFRYWDFAWYGAEICYDRVDGTNEVVYSRSGAWHYD